MFPFWEFPASLDTPNALAWRLMHLLLARPRQLTKRLRLVFGLKFIISDGIPKLNQVLPRVEHCMTPGNPGADDMKIVAKFTDCGKTAGYE